MYHLSRKQTNTHPGQSGSSRWFGIYRMMIGHKYMRSNIKCERKRVIRFCLNTVGIGVVIKFFLRIYRVIQTARVIDYTVKRVCIVYFRKTYIKPLTFIISMKLCDQAMECLYRARANTKVIMSRNIFYERYQIFAVNLTICQIRKSRLKIC